MAIYHFSAKVVKRSFGQSSVVFATRRSGISLFERRLALTHHPLRSDLPVHSEILLPPGAPEHWHDRETLWNEVEAVECRKDSQVAREIEISLPIELAASVAVALARRYAVEVFVAAGIVVDLNVRTTRGSGIEANPWASMLLTTRAISEGKFGPKVRLWNDRRQLIDWRTKWACFANATLRAEGFDGSLDHRSNSERGIELEPQNKIGPAAARRAAAGERMERVEEHKEIAGRNAGRARRAKQVVSATP